MRTMIRIFGVLNKAKVRFYREIFGQKKGKTVFSQTMVKYLAF